MSDLPVQPELHDFLTGARWFGGKGREATIARVHRIAELPGRQDDEPRVVLDLAVVTYADAPDADPEIYQIPLACYPAPQERLAHAAIGLWDDPDLGTVHVYDAVHDREAMGQWLRSYAGTEPGSQRSIGQLAFHRLPGHELDLTTHSTLFKGEQSNSSVAFGEDALMKVFRKVTPGVNPDIAIHQVLTEAGSDHVAALYGWLDIVLETDKVGEPGSVMQLAMLQQFLRTASDGWDLALASVRNLFTEEDLHAAEVGGDFAGEAARLGGALAGIHQTLATQFPTDRVSVAESVAAMHRRLDEALPLAPSLVGHEATLRRVYDAVAALGEVDVQRVHGDLHLGQTLRTVKGWKIVDFEGEPARPLAERMLPDTPWRDVAGMLRSFDYAPRVVAMTADTIDADEATQRTYRAGEWSARNQLAFLAAYTEGDPGGTDGSAGTGGHGTLTATDRVLLDAYVADKAVYEVVYETRNRPTWVAIPLAAIERLGSTTAPGGDA